MATGIYSIRNLVTNRVYVGQAVDVGKRLGQHRSMLRRGKHCNTHLQASYDKHGPDAFATALLQECSVAHLTAYENSYLSYYRGLPGGVYNQVGPAESPLTGSKQSPETLAALSIIRKGRKLSAETKAYLSELFSGRPLTPSWKDNISKAKQGRPLTAAHKQALSEAHRGKLLSETHRRSLSRARKGMASHPDVRAGHRAWLLCNGFPVARVDPATGEVLEVFPIVADVKRSGYTPNSVRLVLQGKQRTHAGFAWKRCDGDSDG